MTCLSIFSSPSWASNIPSPPPSAQALLTKPEKKVILKNLKQISLFRYCSRKIRHFRISNLIHVVKILHLMLQNHTITLLCKLAYDQVSVSVYNLRTNSEKNIFHLKKLVFTVFIDFVVVKPIVIINYGKIFTIVLVDLLKRGLNLAKYP